jgi:hypothetical protein
MYEYLGVIYHITENKWYNDIGYLHLSTLKGSPSQIMNYYAEDDWRVTSIFQTKSPLGHDLLNIYFERQKRGLTR